MSNRLLISHGLKVLLEGVHVEGVWVNISDGDVKALSMTVHTARGLTLFPLYP